MKIIKVAMLSVRWKLPNMEKKRPSFRWLQLLNSLIRLTDLYEAPANTWASGSNSSRNTEFTFSIKMWYSFSYSDMLSLGGFRTGFRTFIMSWSYSDQSQVGNQSDLHGISWFGVFRVPQLLWICSLHTWAFQRQNVRASHFLEGATDWLWNVRVRSQTNLSGTTPDHHFDRESPDSFYEGLLLQERIYFSADGLSGSDLGNWASCDK